MLGHRFESRRRREYRPQIVKSCSNATFNHELRISAGARGGVLRPGHRLLRITLYSNVHCCCLCLARFRYHPTS